MGKTTIDGITYYPLYRNLWDHLTEHQKSNISTYSKRRDKHFVHGDDILNKFTLIGGEAVVEGDGCYETCVCGVSIRKVFFASNLENDQTVNIGSECIHKFGATGFKHLYDTAPCLFCGRLNKTAKGDCINCAPKKQCKNEKLRIAFYNWRMTSTSPLIEFGKYKGKNLRYIVKHDRSYAKWMFANIDDIDIKEYLEMVFRQCHTS